jgi:uncharacterized protein (DUF924 family)
MVGEVSLTGKPPAGAEIPDTELAAEIVRFWTQELQPSDWYAGGEDLDARCRERFAAVWDRLHDGLLERWRACPTAIFGYILLADQLSRNIHRGSHLAFATDRQARAAVKQAIGQGWDMRVQGPARQFFYLPLEHSESVEDQDRAVRLIKERVPDGDNLLLHARVHREIIRSFGRFPTRNAALGRASTAAEAAFVESGGYGRLLAALAPAG